MEIWFQTDAPSATAPHTSSDLAFLYWNNSENDHNFLALFFDMFLSPWCSWLLWFGLEAPFWWAHERGWWTLGRSFLRGKHETPISPFHATLNVGYPNHANKCSHVPYRLILLTVNVANFSNFCWDNVSRGCDISATSHYRDVSKGKSKWNGTNDVIHDV